MTFPGPQLLFVIKTGHRRSALSWWLMAVPSLISRPAGGALDVIGLHQRRGYRVGGGAVARQRCHVKCGWADAGLPISSNNGHAELQMKSSVGTELLDSWMSKNYLSKPSAFAAQTWGRARMRARDKPEGAGVRDVRAYNWGPACDREK